MLGRCYWRCLIGLALGMVLLTGMVGLDGCGAQESVGVEASWAHLYHDIGSLKKASDVAVDGSVAGIAGHTVQDNIPFTDFTFTIQRVVYDPHQLATGHSLLIHQTGGTGNGQQVSLSDDPLFAVGEHDIVFLHQYSPGHFFVEGGSSGRFFVRNGLVSAINDEGIRLSSPVPEATFISQIEQA